MLKREFKADYINEVVNHPSVRWGTESDGSVDLQPVLEDPNNIVLVYEGGGFILLKRKKGYELHTQALKEGRGKKLRQAAIEMFDYMKDRTDLITSMAKKNNPFAIKLAEEFMDRSGEDDKYIYYERVL